MTIKKVQELLDYLDYSCAIDGIWGPETKRKLMQFQADFGIQADGMTGPDTYAALKHAVCYGMDVPDISQGDNLHDSAEDAGNGTGAEQYLWSDGFYHIPRGVNVQLSKNLWSKEIQCQGTGCCTESKISKRVVDLFQDIRDEMGVPLSIGTAGGSGYRCPRHNSDVGGAAGSLHMLSEAIDIHYAIPSALKSVVIHHLKDGEIGLYAWGCHVGCWDRGYISEFNGG